MNEEKHETTQPCEVSVSDKSLWLLAYASELHVLRNQERLHFLKTNMPSNLMQCFNTRNLNLLKIIIDETFELDCQLRTSAVPVEVAGRDKVYEFFHNYIQGCPDVMITNVTPLQFNIRVISFICYEQGTRSNFNVPDELFDHLRHDNVIRTSAYINEKNKYILLRNAGKPIPYRATSYVNFILNKAMTHVEKYIHVCKDIVVED
jgi:hypothetical protein